MAPVVPIDYAGHKESKRFSSSQMMGKSRKFSKGISSGFVPDYRHVVETMGESEGFGSSGRVDAEMTASEDSSAPKRKCVSLNMDSYESFGVPIQLLSLSKMTRAEKKDLERRLKIELEQVRMLQNKISSFCSNVVLSPSSDIRSCSDGKKRLFKGNYRKSTEVLGPQVKRQAPIGSNGALSKKNTSNQFDGSAVAAPTSTSNMAAMKHCENLLNRLMNHQYGWVFNTPVDPVKLNILDYFLVIKHPMDLGTVKSKLVLNGYANLLEFAADVRLTFSNALTYNPAGNDVHFMAGMLSKYFESRWKAIEKKLPVTGDSQPVPSEGALHVESKIHTEAIASKKQKTETNIIKQEPGKRIMSVQEKQNLSTELEALLGELPESIVDFLKEQSFSQGQAGDEEIEIDIDALSDETLFRLRGLLDDYLQESQKLQAKSEPFEMELRNDSGFSNSSMPLKGNDQVDEDVDIVGGNDPPISSYPPVEIERDEAHRNNKRSSSSSSSSDSGSSSSDSDSDSSSASESNAAKASGPSMAGMENLDVGANLYLKKSDTVPAVGNYSSNGSSQVELNSVKEIAVEADGHQEGESAPSERQVSPEKLYRAALLRNRFADTILRAREKALEKGEKRDPEKVQIEREELERKQREEKARLQAEANAAEEARRKAEAEAAAEARRKRGMEREAARQALLKMEKTVDINENSQFMEDLDMLRAAGDQPIPSIPELASPIHSEKVLDSLGSFNFQGTSNPLEQLGLFMKLEDEEDEEVGELPVDEPKPAMDVEDGEID